MCYTSSNEDDDHGAKVRAGIFLKIIFILGSILINNTVLADQLLEHGARVYIERCALCHGPKGLGEGVLPLLVENYPDTSLRGHANRLDLTQLIDAVQSGIQNGRHSQLSPPWEDELSGEEIRAVAGFVQLLQGNLDDAVSLLDKVAASIPSPVSGKHIYRSRCASCHGATGAGDGQLVRVVNNPLPANLIQSSMSRAQLVSIITLGGSAVNRSEQMPPWGQELGVAEINNVVDHLMTLRASCQAAEDFNCATKDSASLKK